MDLYNNYKKRKLHNVSSDDDVSAEISTDFIYTFLELLLLNLHFCFVNIYVFLKIFLKLKQLIKILLQKYIYILQLKADVYLQHFQ